MPVIVYESCITSVKDEIAKLNSHRPPRPLPLVFNESIHEPERPQESQESCIGLFEKECEEDDKRSTSSQSTVASSCSRARRGDIYTLAAEEIILYVIKEIDEGRFVSNTKCVSWARGSKHHPCQSETFKVRRHLLFTGPQTRDQIHEALPGLGEKLLRSILHELKEQGIVTVSN